MFGYYQMVRRPNLTLPLKRSLSTKKKEENVRHEKFFTIFLTKFRDLFGPHFMKRLSSSSLCHAFFQQSQIRYDRLASKNFKFCSTHAKFARKFIPICTSSTFLLAATSFVSANSEDSEEIINDEMMGSHKGDLKYIKSLIKSTLTCEKCHKRHFIDQKVEEIDYCQCNDKKSSVYGVKLCDEPWTPFLERKNILVWRTEHPELKGLYAYKMYGKFEDVSADEFLAVQCDLSEFRLSWDKGSAQCHVIEHKDANRVDQREVNHTYYWEVNWPRFFSNRDYVCSRRAKVFKENGQEIIVLFTKSTQHSNCPKKAKAFRVENYWSVLTIKPLTTSDQPGVEFSLTGFENPGLSLPSYITTWVAIHAMPEFFTNLRLACFERRKWLKKPKEYSTVHREPPSYLETPKHYNEHAHNRNYA